MSLDLQLDASRIRADSLTRTLTLFTACPQLLLSRRFSRVSNAQLVPAHTRDSPFSQCLTWRVTGLPRNPTKCYS